ncbi:MAG: hypothetical protein ACM3IH_13805 [Sphingobacteriales bacterium]|jgi:hypothetical protein
MVFMDTKDWRDDQGRAAIEETIRQAKARRVDYLRENVWPPLGTTSGHLVLCRRRRAASVIETAAGRA